MRQFVISRSPQIAVLVSCVLITITGFCLSKTTPVQPQSSVCEPLRVESPDHPIGLELIMEEARRTHTPVSLAGGGFSQGSQTCAADAIQINTREMNQLISIDIEKQQVTIQAGMTWKRLQEELSFFGFSVAAMQSYADFTIGGSLGVNAHGQDVSWNPVSSSVVSIKVLLTDGRHLYASRTKNPDLFRAAIGSYGLIGIITEVTLNVVPNTILHKKTKLVRTRNYNEYFESLHENHSLALHSARLSINPLYRFKNAVAVNFIRYGEIATLSNEQTKPALPDAKYLNLLKSSWLARVIRTTAEYFFLEREARMTRNQAMGESVTSLKNTATGTKDILQEYFIPPEHLQEFIRELETWVARNHHLTLINATVRWVNADQDSLLPYAPENRFAVVLFMNLPDTTTAGQTMQQATRELIDTTLRLKGRYYLPYALYASREQMYQTYPEFQQLLEEKKRWDRDSLLTNHLYQTYGTPDGSKSSQH